MRSILALLAVTAACSGPDASPTPGREHHAALVGTWVVDQPNHALYESTHYELHADGAVTVGVSFPDDCSGHLSEHCVTGSVARCAAGGQGCDATSCVFGSEWWSDGPSTLVIAGECSDGVARPIAIDLATAAVLSVGGETGWSHDNWDWAFRKCEGAAPCSPF